MIMDLAGKMIVPDRTGREGKNDRDQLLDGIPVQGKARRMVDTLIQQCIQQLMHIKVKNANLSIEVCLLDTAKEKGRLH